MAQGYCIKCKSKQAMINGVLGIASNGANIEKGICATCGTKIMRFLSKEEKKSMDKPAVDAPVEMTHSEEIKEDNEESTK